MPEPDVQLHDDPPPEWDEATVETDLYYAAAAGGFTDDDSMADADDLVEGIPDADTDLTAGTDPDVIERTRAWLGSHPGAVNEEADDGS